jgi:hypothetical protein
MEGYRSGHNGADSKSVGQGNLARGFESHLLRQQTGIHAGYKMASIDAPINWSKENIRLLDLIGYGDDCGFKIGNHTFVDNHRYCVMVNKIGPFFKQHFYRIFQSLIERSSSYGLSGSARYLAH